MSNHQFAIKSTGDTRAICRATEAKRHISPATNSPPTWMVYKTGSNFAQDRIGSASGRRRTWPTGLLHLLERNCGLGQGKMPNTAFVMSPRSCLLERIIPTDFWSHLVLLISTLCLSWPSVCRYWLKRATASETQSRPVSSMNGEFVHRQQTDIRRQS